MRRIRGDYGNAAGLNFTFFIADRNPGRAFDDERNFDVGMLMQRRTLPGFGGDDVSGERRALRFADELMRHSNERQLLEIQKTHVWMRRTDVCVKKSEVKERFVGHARAR